MQERLGAMIDRARDGDFPLRPLEDSCPRLQDRGAFCDFGDACRLRVLPLPPSADSQTDMDDDGGEA